ncbi:MerR family transcriptional regulator [Glaciibacter superstes]|uniref:MerR family transcriptional regulator n=1 Tax=Glaciibacter superstes TaxID=501023 RepID=UPI0003B669B0|nr:MerR family transcriptional regulator [Glaciibacter superstes]
MQISHLATESGVGIATIKFYLREGLLQQGDAVSATRADYGQAHLDRLRLIKALTGAAGLPVQRAGEVLAIIDHPDGSLFEMLGRAVAALPPYADAEIAADGAAADDAGAPRDYPRARAALAELGQLYDPRYAAVAQLDQALAAAESVGMPASSERLAAYGVHLKAMAEIDLASVTEAEPAASVEYAVLGTALYDPVILALRRLAHQDLAARRLGVDQAAIDSRQ